MNNQGGSNDNIHLGDTTVFGDLEVTEDLKIDGSFEVVGDLVVDPPNCLKTDCIKPSTASGNIDIQNSSGNTVVELYDDQTMGAFSIFGFGGLTLSSNSTGNAVAQLDAGLGVNTAGLRLPSTKLNVDEIQSQTHEVSGNNPKILFTASKVEITGDTAIDFETASILTTEIKKDASGGDLIVRAADGTQVLKVDDNLDEVYIGEDADGWRMPKLRGAIGSLLTMSNTGVATYEEPAQTGGTQVIGTIVTPRILYSAGVFENIASSYAGTTVIQPNTWSIGDVFTVNIRGEWTAISANTRTAFFRLDLGQSLLSQVSDDVSPGSLSASSANPFELFVGLTRISTTEINWVANGWRRDTNNVTRIIKFGDGKVSSYDESLALDVSILFQDNSTSGAGNPTIYFECMSGIWAQSTTASVIPVITTSDHTALSNLQLGDAGHNQFALLNGRNGGQILSGSNLTAEGLTIRSNSVDPSTASITMTSDLNMSSKDVSAVGALQSVSATLDEFLTIGDGKTSSELKFKGSTSGLNRIYVEPNQGIALNILTDTFVSLMAFNSQVGSEAVGILKPLDMVGNIVENVIQLDTGAYGDMTVKRNGVDKIVVGDTKTTFAGDTTVGGVLRVDSTTPILELIDNDNTVWGNGSGNITFKGNVGGLSAFIGEMNAGLNFGVVSYAPTKNLILQTNSQKITLAPTGILSLPGNLDMDGNAISAVSTLVTSGTATIGGDLIMTSTEDIFHPPSLTSTQQVALTSVSGDVIFNTDHKTISVHNGDQWSPLANKRQAACNRKPRIFTVDEWTLRSAAASKRWQTIIWSDELEIFVAVAIAGTPSIQWSEDGVLWTSASGTGALVFQDVAWSPELGIFCAVGSNSTDLATSPDGKVWTPVAGTPVKFGITWCSNINLFIACVDTGNIYTSTDGTTWVSQTLPAGTYKPYNVKWSSELGLAVVVGNGVGSTSAILTSPDGKTWTSRTFTGDATYSLWGICYSPELCMFLALDFSTTTQSRAVISYDGITWTAHSTSDDTVAWKGCAWSPELGLFITMASGKNSCQTSPDGINWTEVVISSAAAAEPFSTVAWSSKLGIFAAVSNQNPNSNVWTSGFGIGLEGGLTVGSDLTVAGDITGDTGTGWGYWVSTDYATPIAMNVGVKTKLINNGLGGNVIDQIPTSGHLFWNQTTSLIEPEFDGDCYDMEIRIEAENNNASGYYTLSLEIGTGGTLVSIPLPIFNFPKGANTLHDVSSTTLIFCKAAFLATGGTLFLTSGLGTTTVSKFSIVLNRNHRAR